MTRFEAFDAHVHVGPPRYAPVTRYVDTMKRHGQRHAVLVQQLGVHDNGHLLDCLDRYPERFVGIVAVDPTDPDAADETRKLAAHPAVRGLRLPADARSPGRHPLAIWRVADELGLVVSVAGPFATVTSVATRRLVDSFPGVHFRFEHLGWLRFADDPPPHLGFADFLRLAESPNTSTMWSGFFLNSRHPHPYPDAHPFLERSLAAFGSGRIAWSGDWNRPNITDANYDRAISLVRADLPFLDDTDRDAILGATSATIFHPEHT